MELQLDVKGQVLRALSADHLESLRKTDKSDCPRVIDLRKIDEMDEDPTKEFKEARKPYLRLPVGAGTLSEQDMDQLRREFGRRQGPYAVISTGGLRAATVVLMHAGRTLKWDHEQALVSCPELARSDRTELKELLRSYLERHRIRTPG